MTRKIEEIIEEQIARWREGRKQRPALYFQGKDKPAVITLSHALASGGQAIADGAGQLLGLPVYDHQIVRYIAKTAEVHLELVESLDKHVLSYLEEFIAGMLHERNFDRGDYLRYLGGIVLALWAQGPCLISGHGAVHLVPRDHALAVRISAPHEARIARLVSREKVDVKEAARRIHRADAEMHAYHHRFFGTEVDDPLNYDLHINTEKLGPEDCAALIAEAYRRKLPGHRGLT